MAADLVGYDFGLPMVAYTCLPTVVDAFIHAAPSRVLLLLLSPRSCRLRAATIFNSKIKEIGHGSLCTVTLEERL